MKGRILFIVAVVVFVAVVPMVYWLLFERGLSVSTSSSPAPMAPSDVKVELVEQQPEEAPVALSVTDLEGRVEITRGKGGKWREAEEGMVLAAQDRIRTDLDARATLAMPGVFAIQLTPESEFKVNRLAQNAFKFLLEEGMVSADVVDNADHLFEVAGSSAVATTRGGAFQMHVDREGHVALGTSRGSVDLESGGKVVQVNTGYQARVERGKVPNDPIRIPKKLFLKVRWPTKRELSSRKLLVAGRTAPGARVLVDGSAVQVDKRGRFRKVVALTEGANRVRVDAADVGGNKASRRSPKFKVDTRADGFRIHTSPDMWKKNKKKTGN